MSLLEMRPIGIDAAAIRLTDILLGYDQNDLADTLREIAAGIGVKHIAYLRLSSEKNIDTKLLTAEATYSPEWKARYFLKQYIRIDPVVAQGVNALLPFDWQELEMTPAAAAFFADAQNHGVGGRGVSIPVRNRRNSCALVSLTSDMDREEWEDFKRQNMMRLQLLSALIDSAAAMYGKLPDSAAPMSGRGPAAPVKLSKREEQCLLWAARGKTYQETAEILGISFGSVKTHLDTARHKLHCLNLTHAVAVAIATEVLPAKALVQSAGG